MSRNDARTDMVTLTEAARRRHRMRRIAHDLADACAMLPPSEHVLPGLTAEDLLEMSSDYMAITPAPVTT